VNVLAISSLGGSEDILWLIVSVHHWLNDLLVLFNIVPLLNTRFVDPYIWSSCNNSSYRWIVVILCRTKELLQVQIICMTIKPLGELGSFG